MHGLHLLPRTGYCRVNVNSWLPRGIKFSSDVQECIDDCALDSSCRAVTFDEAEELCEFQCSKPNHLCDLREFPPGNLGDLCVTMTDDRHDKSFCFTYVDGCEEKRRRMQIWAEPTGNKDFP